MLCGPPASPTPSQVTVPVSRSSLPSQRPCASPRARSPAPAQAGLGPPHCPPGSARPSPGSALVWGRRPGVEPRPFATCVPHPHFGSLGAAELGTFDGPRRRPGRSARGGRREPQDAQRSAEGGEAAQASRAGGAAGPWLARPVPQRQGAAPWAEGAGGSPVQRRASPGREEKSQRHWFVTLQNGGIYTSFWWRWWPRPDSGGLPWVTAAARHRRPERPARGRATPNPARPPGRPRPSCRPASSKPRASSPGR